MCLVFEPGRLHMLAKGKQCMLQFRFSADRFTGLPLCFSGYLSHGDDKSAGAQAAQEQTRPE